MKNNNIETSMILVDSFEIGQGTINLLKKNQIYNLEQLLNLEYGELTAMRGFGEKALHELKNYLHEYGFSLKNEYKSVDERRKEYHEERILILEDLGFSSYVYLTLYKNNIYTLEDLLKYGYRVFDIKSFGPVRQRELERKMKDLGLSFDLNLTEQLEKIVKYNENYKNSVKSKEELSEIYQDLLLKRQMLVEDNAKLDQMLVDLQSRTAKVLGK